MALAEPNTSTPESIATAVRHLADATWISFADFTRTRTTPSLPPELDPINVPCRRAGLVLYNLLYQRVEEQRLVRPLSRRCAGRWETHDTIDKDPEERSPPPVGLDPH